MTKDVKARLNELAEEDYKKFTEKLLPGVDNILGVRIPKLRDFAKEIVKGQWREYLKEAKENTYEEILLQGLVIGYGKMTLEERFQWLDFFVPKINSWGVCDSSCTTYKFMKKHQKESFEYIKKYIRSDKEYEVRFAVISMLAHFINDDYIDEILCIFESIKHDGYYVKMGVAWAVSMCFIKYIDKTLEFLKENKMDDFTHNKSIQKICESNKVEKEIKEMIRELKRKDIKQNYEST